MESQGFRRMEIVEVSDSESDEGAGAPAATPPQSSSAPSGGWRRMEIVEASDDESDSGTAPLATARGNSASSTSAPRSAAPEPSADIKVEPTVKGIEVAKDRANGLFSQGSLEESVRWFGKAIWMAESGRVPDMPGNLYSILHSNRAFAYVKLRRWPEAEEDCSSALRLNPQNTKAKYRRAMARFELGRADDALKDVDEVLRELPDASSQKEAHELRQRIQDRLAITKPPDAAGESAGGWRRMEIVEASDDEDETGQVFRKIPIVEVDDEEDPHGLAGEDQAQPNGAAGVTEERAPEAELYPDVQIERTRQGIEKAKNQGNALFSQGKYEESERWFSKAIWLLRSALVKDVPSDLHSILHSNHAFALIKLQRWSEAEEECSSALTFNGQNTKATYRRALSRFELGRLDEALKDVEVVIKEMPDPMNNKEATELKEKISEALKKRTLEEDVSSEPFPDIDIQKTRQGIEAAKNQANALFSKGSLEECVRWFSKAIWLLQSGEVTDVPSDLHSVLHSNRSFAYVRMKKWREAEEDSSAALGLNPANTKARYRRAVARFELGRAEAALQDVEQVLVELPDPASNKEAKELKDRIAASLKQATPNGVAERAGTPTGAATAAKAAAKPESAAAMPEPAQPAPGFKRMQIVEASDDSDEEPAEASKAAAAAAKAKSPPPQPAPGFKRMQIVEASDSEEEQGGAEMSTAPLAPATKPKSPTAATTPTQTQAQPAPGFKRMQIVEASDSEEEQEGAKKSTTTPAPAPKPMSSAASVQPAQAQSQQTPGFKRMQIVEASDSEEDEKASTPPAPAAAPALPPGKAQAEAEEAEVFPDIEVERTREGIEAVKNRANGLFSKGSLDESVRWFTKAIWLIQSKKVDGVPADLQSIIHSNRAFAYVRLQKWPEAEEDSSAALALNNKNSKAVYRRALARFELGKLEAALKDVDQVLRDIPDPSSNKEAVELKRKIVGKLAAPAPAPAAAAAPVAAAPKEAAAPAPGFKRMQIVEASDSEEEEEDVKSPKAPAPSAKPKSPSADAKPSSPPSGAAASAKAAAKPEPAQPAPGFKRMQIVEASDDSDEEPAEAPKPVAADAKPQSKGALEAEEPFPDIKVEHTKQGVEAAKNQANTLFSKGSVEESIRWFSKAIWLVQSGRVPDVPLELQSILHSNRAFAHVKLQSWPEAVEDCSAALEKNSKNTKARYRRALARFELGELDAALQDVEQVLLELPDPSANKEAVALKSRIHDARKAPSPREAPQKVGDKGVEAAKQEPQAGGWRRMEIVEASDDEDEAPGTSSPAEVKPSPTPSPPPQPPSPAPGFKRMQIVEASDSESDGDAAGGAAKPAAPPQPPKADEKHVANGAEEPDVSPDIKIEHTRQGIEAAKNQANALFSKGDVAESVRWFSKAIWLVQSGRVADVPNDLRSILRANRAFAHLKLQRWHEAEEDCSAALALNSTNTKAKYRRAWARFELGEADAALQEVEEVLRELPAGSANKEAVDLQQRILKALPPKETPASASPKKRVSFNEAKNEYASLNDIPKLSPAAASPTTPRGAPAAAEPEEFPDIKVERTRQGIESAKNQANALFSKGSVEESARWFSKALWLVQSGRVSESIPSDLHSILRSNRAFAYIKLKRWQEADADCSEALALNGSNTKAKYRRAMARFELGKHQEALQDVEQVLKELPDPKANKEAVELKERIDACLKPPQPSAAQEAASAAGAEGAPAAPPTGWKRMEIVEASDDDESGDDAPKPAPAGAPAQAPEPAPGFKRMTIVEESDDDGEEQVAPPATKSEDAELFPDIKVEPTRQGVTVAKDQANSLFTKGSVEESVRWFSKALWLVKSGRAKDVPDDLRSILHSNRAFAYVRLKRWGDAEQDCSEALDLNGSNTKARYRRALARCELGQNDTALQDVERVLQELPDPNSNREAVELKRRIEEARKAAPPPGAAAPVAAAPAPQQPSTGGGWKRMQIVEASDDEDSGGEPATEAQSPAAPGPEARTTPASPSPAAQPAAQPAPGFKRMQIVEASDDDSEGEAEKTAPPPSREPAPAASDPFPDVEVECTVQGIEAAKQQANGLFTKGSLEESIRWFSKAIFLAESGRVPGLPSDQHSVLHSNRSFAYVKLQKWASAEEDCCVALDLNPKNTKAKYRRALARFELGKLEAALQEVDEVLKDLPDPSSNREAAQLKQRILEQQSKRAPDGPPKEAKPEVVKAAPAPVREDAPTRAVGSTATVAASEDPEPMPDIVIELSKDGVEQAKNRANTLFSQGALDESVRWFSKVLWLLESRRVTDVPFTLHSILHSNRAFAYIRLDRWREAEEDCAAALDLNRGNTKARYRRAMACLELGKLELALQDVEQVLKELPDPSSNREARELQGKILERRKQEAGGKEEAGGPLAGPAAERAAGAAPSGRGPLPGSDEEFPDIRIEHSVDGVQRAKEQGNLLFSQGSTEESARWFSKALWLIASGRVEDVQPDVHSILHSNRAFAYIRLQRWAEAVEDGSAALVLNGLNRKARYRRAIALTELGRLEAALEDVEQVLRESVEPASQREAGELKQRILQSLGKGAAVAAAAGSESVGSPSGGSTAKGEASSPAAAGATKGAPATSSRAVAAAAPLAGESSAATSKPAPASPTGAAEAAPRSAARVRGAAVVRAVGAPSVPSSTPKTASELLRHFNSMKRHPEILARYIRERVPPQLMYSLFSKSPIEPDDLATLLSALRTNVQEQLADFSPEVAGDYLRHLLRSRNAETQFAMLSSSEKQVLRELVHGVPPGSEGRRSLEGSLAKVLD